MLGNVRRGGALPREFGSATAPLKPKHGLNGPLKLLLLGEESTGIAPSTRDAGSESEMQLLSDASTPSVYTDALRGPLYFELNEALSTGEDSEISRAIALPRNSVR